MNKKTLIFLLLFVIIFVSFTFRLWPLQISHWWDECVYLQHSEVIFSGRTNYDEFILRPPLLPLMISFSYLFIHHSFTAGFVVALLGTIGVFFIYLIGKEGYNKTVGLLAALFLGFSPFIVRASHWIMTSVPSLTFIIISC